jgi:hypothetical protein
VDPHYKISDLIEACVAGNVSAWKPATDGARSDFNLYTEAELLKFIGNSGLEKLTFINCKELEKWAGGSPSPMVDAYSFYSGDTFGYIAFYRGAAGRWLIKSFKKNFQSDDRFLPFAKLKALMEESKERGSKEEEHGK